MFVGPTGRRVLVMALSWNYLVDYCMDYIMAVVAFDHEEMSLKVHVLTLVCVMDVAGIRPLSRSVPVPARDDTSDHHNSVLAIVHHCWFLHYYNMDPRWNFLGYQNILVMWVAVMIVVSKFWISNTVVGQSSLTFCFSFPIVVNGFLFFFVLFLFPL